MRDGINFSPTKLGMQFSNFWSQPEVELHAKKDEGRISTAWVKAHEGLRPSGWGKGEFPEETWPPLNLLFRC